MGKNRIFGVTLAAACALMVLPAAGQDEATLTQDARKLAGTLQQSLAGKLMAEIKANGPAAAIGVCTTIGPGMAAELSRHNGVRLTRVSLKVRNPLLGAPDGWEQGVLKRFDDRLASGEKPEALEYAETVTEPAGRYFRYVKALPVQPLCLNCHGASDQIAAEVKQRLAQDYPKDLATGYSVGQVRGAISIKRPL